MEIGSNDRPMYLWRKWTEERKKDALRHRRKNKLPWHSIPHRISESKTCMLTAACYEHKANIGVGCERLGEFEKELLNELLLLTKNIFAWVILPNHYHALVETNEISELLKILGKMHGRISDKWNGEESTPGTESLVQRR